MEAKYKKIFRTMGASNHSDEERQKDDYYATEPKAVELLLEKEKFTETVWECACGEGHISKALIKAGYKVVNSDIEQRSYPCDKANFFEFEGLNTMDIVTNPPYKIGKEFVKHALDISADGVKVAMFLKLTFLESRARRKLFEEYPPKVIYVASGRLQCAKNGEFEKYKGVGTAIAHAWFVWEKGYAGEPIVKWIN